MNPIENRMGGKIRAVTVIDVLSPPTTAQNIIMTLTSLGVGREIRFKNSPTVVSGIEATAYVESILGDSYRTAANLCAAINQVGGSGYQQSLKLANQGVEAFVEGTRVYVLGPVDCINSFSFAIQGTNNTSSFTVNSSSLLVSNYGPDFLTKPQLVNSRSFVKTVTVIDDGTAFMADNEAHEVACAGFNKAVVFISIPAGPAALIADVNVKLYVDALHKTAFSGILQGNSSIGATLPITGDIGTPHYYNFEVNLLGYPYLSIGTESGGTYDSSGGNITVVLSNQ